MPKDCHDIGAATAHEHTDVLRDYADPKIVNRLDDDRADFFRRVFWAALLLVISFVLPIGFWIMER